MSRVDAAVQRVVERADGLPDGDVEHHVKASAHELQAACIRGDGVAPAVIRLVDSLHQLQATRADGLRRREQQDAPALERLLETLQEDLLPELRRNGLI